jgi:hypothetical protein
VSPAAAHGSGFDRRGRRQQPDATYPADVRGTEVGERRGVRAADAAWWWPVALWLLAVVAVFLSREASAAILGWGSNSGPLGEYLLIAEHGYAEGSYRLGWFPGYPLAIRAVATTGVGVRTAAALVATVGSAAAVAALWDWARSMGMSVRARGWAVTALLAWPVGFMLLGSVVLSEGLFLGLAFGACAANERRRAWPAALLLVAACATRPNGALFAFALAARNLERGGVVGVNWERRRLPRLRVRPGALRASHLVPLLGLAGGAAFFVYCGTVHGDPFIYFSIQDSMTPSPPKGDWRTWTHWSVLSPLKVWRQDPWNVAAIALNGGLTMLVACSVPATVRRFGLGYAALTAGVVALIWFGGWDFPSATRYLLAALPFFALVGEHAAERRRPWPAVLGVSALVMVWFAAIFHSGGSLPVTW